VKKNIFCALDLDFQSALGLTKQLKDHIYGIKIGSLFNQIGIEGLKEFDQLNLPLFVDSKFSDIPSVTVRNILNLKELKNIEFVTIHSLSSREMMEEAVKAAESIKKKIKILAVLITTSSTQKTLTEIGIQNNLEEQVKKLAKLSYECGLHGVISPGKNYKMIRELLGPNSYIIVPGIRPDEQKEKDDQKNTISYTEFNKMTDGDDKAYCVIGRPIYKSENPLESLKKIVNQ
jgi:orotidine-5'-phosphate decarboxylase